MNNPIQRSIPTEAIIGIAIQVPTSIVNTSAVIAKSLIKDIKQREI